MAENQVIDLDLNNNQDCIDLGLMEVFEIVGPILGPLLSWTEPLIGIFYKLPFIGNDWYIQLNKGLNWAIITLANTSNKLQRLNDTKFL